MGNNVNSILFRPPAPTLLHPSCRFWLQTCYGNKLAAVFFKRSDAKVTILYSHANAEDLGMMFGWLKCLSRRLNVNILAYDYSGYGESNGVPSEENCYADIDAAFEHLISFRGLSSKQIVLYGRSVGSGPATYLAEKCAEEGIKLGGLILECPFKSVLRVVADVGFTVVGDKFPNIDRLPNINCPTMIIHGKEDTVIPIQHGLDLYRAIPADCVADCYWVQGKGHNDLDYNYDPLIHTLDEFLEHNLNKYMGSRNDRLHQYKERSRTRSRSRSKKEHSRSRSMQSEVGREQSTLSARSASRDPSMLSARSATRDPSMKSSRSASRTRSQGQREVSVSTTRSRSIQPSHSRLRK